MKNKTAFFNDLELICQRGVHRDVPLSKLSRWKVGGVAEVIVEPQTVEELCKLRSYFHKHQTPFIVIGETSNLLFDDDGLEIPCIKIGSKMSRVRIERDYVVAEAGVWVPLLARKIMQAGLTGGEHICGIPGTLGGLIVMNGGSQRKGIGDAVVEVQVVDRSGRCRVIDHDECCFDYRSSVFQTTDDIISSVVLKFSAACNPSIVRREMLSILRDRRQKFPNKEPNCGSVFKSNPSIYAAVGPPGGVIEKLGFKGYRIGDAAVSTRHANFIVNMGNASSLNVLEIIRRISKSVSLATGYDMETEIIYVNKKGQFRSAQSEHLINDNE